DQSSIGLGRSVGKECALDNRSGRFRLLLKTAPDRATLRWIGIFFSALQLSKQHIVQFGDRISPLLEHFECFRSVQRSQIHLRRSLMLAIKGFDGVEI